MTSKTEQQKPGTATSAPWIPFEAQLPPVGPALDEYRRRLVAKRRAMYWVGWDAAPLWAKFLQLSAAVMIIGGLVALLCFVLSAESRAASLRASGQQWFDSKSASLSADFEARKAQMDAEFEAGKAERRRSYEAAVEEMKKRSEENKSRAASWLDSQSRNWR